jgi:predicted Zn-dependent protease
MSGMRLLRSFGLALGVGLLGAGHANAAAAESSGAGGARWVNPIVRVTVDESLLALGDEAFEAVIGAVSAWQESDPYLPTLIVEKSERRQVIGYDAGGTNQNSVVFVPDGAKVAKGALAITIITFDQESGQVLDADVVVNGEHAFGVAESMSQEARTAAYDVQNVLTHEFGHFLGLGEEYEHQGATMYAYSLPGETEKRDLDSLDEERITSLYVESSQGAAAPAGCNASIAGRMSDSRAWLVVALCAAGFTVAARRRATLARNSIALLLGLFAISGAPATAYRAEVHALESHWEDGLIVTTAMLKPAACQSCAVQKVQVFGGTVKGVSQQVGLLRPLKVGDQVSVGAVVPEALLHHGASVIRIGE